MAEVVASPLLVPQALAAAVSGALAVYAWRRRSKPGAGPFVAVMVAVAAWAVINGLNVSLYHPATYPLRSATEWGVSTLVPVFWLVFALAYTGRTWAVSAGTVLGLSVVPAVTVVVVLAGDPGLLYAADCGSRVVPGLAVVREACPKGPWFYVHLTYAYTLVVVGMALLFRTALASESMYTDQAASVLVGVLVPLSASVAWALGWVPVTGFDPTPASFTVGGLAIGHAVFRYSFLDVVPATRRIGERAAVADLKNGVVIVDDRDRVLTVNDAAGRLFGVDPDAVVGDPLSTLVGEGFDPGPGPGETVADLETDDGVREFEVTVSPISDDRDGRIGTTLVFRDVTDRVRRKQQLEALNRVLRHNLRNDMNVVQGYADTLSERTTDPEAAMAERIAEQSAELVEVGTKVRDMERITDRTEAECRPFDFNERVRAVLDGVRGEFPDGRVVLHLPRELHLRSDELVVETVLTNVVRNALEGDDADAPRVAVTARPAGPDDGWVEVTVAGDGPGIPEQDRRAVLEGTETDLRHASGLGLWVANWGITHLGGEIGFDDREDGTVVELRFPGRVDPGSDTDPDTDPDRTRGDLDPGADAVAPVDGELEAD